MRKILCIVLIYIICSFTIISYAEDEITDLQKEHQTLQNQIQDASTNLEDLQNELSDNLIQVQKLDEKISSSQTELDELKKEITDLQTKIDEVEKNLETAEKNYEKRKEILKKRIISTYEAGETQYLDVILGSKSLSDFLSRYYLISEVASYDKQLLDEVESQKKEIEQSKENLQKDKELLTTMKQNQTKTSKILQNTKTLRENYISQLSEREKEIQTQIDEYTARFAEVNAEILELALNGEQTTYIGGIMAWPVPGYTRITSNYGMRTHPITGVYKLHTGVDIGAPMGANFIAVTDGIVVKAEYNSAYGKMVVIDHGGGISTLYAHGSEILVEVGQTVKRGESVLKVGSTGYSTGPHAHFEVRINGVVTNPIEYITSNKLPEGVNQNTSNTDNTTNTTNSSNTTEQTNTTENE